jgi:hypothetical protein
VPVNNGRRPGLPGGGHNTQCVPLLALVEPAAPPGDALPLPPPAADDPAPPPEGVVPALVPVADPMVVDVVPISWAGRATAPPATG